MAGFESEQDEPNRVRWLATWAGKRELSSMCGTACCILQEKFPPKPYNNILLIKFVWSRLSFFRNKNTLKRCRRILNYLEFLRQLFDLSFSEKRLSVHFQRCIYGNEATLSVLAYGRMDTYVTTTNFEINGLPNFLRNGAPIARLGRGWALLKLKKLMKYMEKNLKL